MEVSGDGQVWGGMEVLGTNIRVCDNGSNVGSISATYLLNATYVCPTIPSLMDLKDLHHETH